jgi:hypothetical protein
MEDKSTQETNGNKPLGTLSHRIFHNEMMEKERAISDRRYAPSWQGKIIVAACAVILTIVLSGIVYLVVNSR